MKNFQILLGVLFKALGLHDSTKRLLLIFILVAFAEAPFAIPNLWNLGYGMYYKWKNNLPPGTTTTSLVSKPNSEPIPPPETHLSYPRSSNAGEGIIPHPGPRVAKAKHPHYEIIPLPAGIVAGHSAGGN